MSDKVYMLCEVNGNQEKRPVPEDGTNTALNVNATVDDSREFSVITLDKTAKELYEAAVESKYINAVASVDVEGSVIVSSTIVPIEIFSFEYQGIRSYSVKARIDSDERDRLYYGSDFSDDDPVVLTEVVKDTFDPYIISVDATLDAQDPSVNPAIVVRFGNFDEILSIIRKGFASIISLSLKVKITDPGDDPDAPPQVVEHFVVNLHDVQVSLNNSDSAVVDESSIISFSHQIFSDVGVTSINISFSRNTDGSLSPTISVKFYNLS